MTEVPVCDVVCDAVEYLSKLGANLRTRSENLKDKKISKSKLKNTHAVQKAASKLLLICEISKKSLDNVERGMRNVLSIVNKGQAQEESSSDVKSPKGDSKFQYFEFENYKLKISKKVPVKHFISVKVLTKILPRPTLDKYPVYYDCKLFRLRKKQSEHENQESLETCTSTDQNNKLKVTKKIHDSDSDNSTAAASKDDSGQGDKPIIEVETQDSNQSFKNKTTKPQTARRSKIKISDSETEIDTQTTKKDSNVENESEKSDVLPSTSEVECDSIIELDTSANASAAAECIKDSLKKDIDTKKMKKIVRFADESDLSDKEQAQKEVQIEDKKSNKEKQNENASDSDDDVVCISDTDQNNVEEKSASKTKPLIKCVSLSKLLKPNIINSIVDKQIGIKTYVNNKKVCKREDNSSKQKAEEAYWDFKRKEVSAFKSKKFVINIVRLGEFTNEFLVKNNLRKITQLGKVVLEISSPQKNNRILLTPSPPEHVVDTTLTTVESEKIKKSLLNESDSDSDTEICAAKNKNIKRNRRALCISDESDSNKSENISNLENSNAEKNNLCEPSSDESTNATESNKESDKPREKNEKIKKALLDDSDSSNDEVVKKNVAKEKESNTKSALLNSDSDENEETNAKRRKSISVEPPTILESDEQQKGNDKEKFSEPPTILESDEQQKGNDKEKFSEPPTILESDEQQKGNDKEKFSEPPTILESDEQQKGNDKEKFSEPPTILESDEQQNKENDKESFSEPFIGFDSKPGGEIVSKRKRSRDGDTPPPKTMRIESGDDDDDDAKKMLLTYSSEEEDEQLTMSLKKIKDSLLNAGSSEDESSSHNKKKIKESDKKSEQKDKAESSRSSADEDSSNEHQNKRKKLLRKKIGHRKTKQRRDSSSNNSDTQDEKHINGLVNLKTLVRKRRRRRRRQSSSSNSAEANLKDGLSNTMAKAPKICDEDILEADSTSEAGTEDDDGNEEELPNVNLSGLNGDGVDHLAKDDLLDESNSSDGKDKDTEDNKKDTSEDSDTLRSKRRKANAISSDSEAGSSRKNRDLDDDDVKMSDFEEDSEDSSKPKKSKRKREEKKKSDDSDVSSSGSNEGKKKRRRIKQVDDSDLSGSDNENEGRNKHGRKNIRKVMGKNQLEEATKKAAREEKERVARIAERQKLYNNLDFDESGKPDEVVLEKVVLDFDTETKEPLIQVDKGLVKKLKPHQANGIKFMWDACFESVKRIKKDKGSGCILAHCMGLGKTLQVISLTHTLLTHSELTGVQRVLVVCPLSTVLNWVNEFKMWLRNTKNDYEVDIYELSRFKPNSERAFQLQQWFDHGGVCVLGYEMFRNLSADNPKKFKKKMLKSFQQSLVDPGPDLVVCDEGHLLKNEKTSLSQSMNRVRTLRRIVLTGTPLQNNLKEYYCMVQFVKPNLLGKYNEYLNRFVNPITNGQYTDSTEHDIKIMKRRSHVLHKMLDGAVQRRDYGVLAPFLPPKHEYVLFITLTEVQTKLYQHYLDNYSRRPLAGKSSGFLFPDFQSLQRIWTHPLVLKYNSERYEIMQQKKRDREEEDESEGSLADFIDDDSTPDESSTDESSDDMSDASDDSRKKHKKKKASKKKEKGKHSTRRGTRANPVELDDTDVAEIVEVKNENPTEWWMRLVDEPQLDDLRNSHKLVLLFDILRHCEAIGDKLLVFSQSLYSLDLIEHFLGKVDEATQEGRIDEKLGGHVGSWSPGIDYFRLDGQTSCENRSIWCKNFNREDNPRARLFLISTRAGGLGINLVAANRVVIFDVSWNPSHDVQSIFRVYRFGQKKPCYVYRFLAMGTMEEKIYERQVTKQAISKRVIDEQQIDRHYAENDLAELYKFEPEPPSPRPLPPLPKDRLFAELLKEHEKLIYKYHEHDSLLENKEEETLSEEERKAAWEDFENEKNRPPPAPFPNTWNMHNGMMSGLLAQQQQQQVAYAALATLLRKDLPNVSEQQIRDMLPLIYNANPQLMQKMSDMYKYATPGMMNAAMMNPAMRTGGVGSGSSSLAYEPPWQRQQQQQQQMRLQQLLQHQSNMGAKYYAGGLGSRDPVAMALQQQRAREMLTAQGEGSGDAGRRPRGRPPLQVRVPLPAGAPAPPGGASAAPRPAPAADVVNLDSD